MRAIEPYMPLVIRTKKPALSIPAWDDNAGLFLPVNNSTLAYLRGMTAFAINERYFTGTESEIETALNSLKEQITQPALTKEQVCELPDPPIGAYFRGIEQQLHDVLLQAMMSEGAPPPPWEFRVIETENGLLWQYRTQEE